jgi:hypothetical protein
LGEGSVFGLAEVEFLLFVENGGFHVDRVGYAFPYYSASFGLLGLSTGTLIIEISLDVFGFMLGRRANISLVCWARYTHCKAFSLDVLSAVAMAPASSSFCFLRKSKAFLDRLLHTSHWEALSLALVLMSVIGRGMD